MTVRPLTEDERLVREWNARLKREGLGVIPVRDPAAQRLKRGANRNQNRKRKARGTRGT